MKLYLVTHRMMPAGLRAAQLCHAMRQFAAEHELLEQDWFEKSNTIVLLETEDTGSLRAVFEDAKQKEIPVSAFLEPDRDNELTAIALGPDGRQLVRRLPLAFT